MVHHRSTPEASAYPLADHHAAMLDTIAAALAACRALLPNAEAYPADLDLAAAGDRETFGFANGARVLTEALMAEVLGGTPNAAADPMIADALGALRRELDAVAVRMNRKRRDMALGDAAAMVREIGLDRYDLDCALATDRHGAEVMVCVRVPPATAHALLLSRLLQRTEMFAFSDEFLVLERQASAWYFDTWSAPRYGSESAEFTRTLREQEWSLVSRDSLVLDESMMTAFMADEAFGDVPLREQRLAHGLQRSVIDAFEITSVDGSMVIARSLRDGMTYHVHEHNDEVLRLGNGIILGRLIPLEEHLWVRSPGTVAFTRIDEDRVSLLAEGFTRLGGIMPAPLIIEAMIATVVFGESPPRQLSPTFSARHARELLDKLYPALDALGLRQEVPVSEVPAELAAQARGHELPIMGYALDETMAQWMEALSAQAGSASPAPSGPLQSTKGKKSRRRKGKRRG